ncbi:MAG: NADH-quinone oxidoreductase subunit J [Candidatus Methanomethylophilus sp.]|jgi:NADH:ubiquinone oxidoreductase subunit 6 (subunit J)|nr:NADH-quinone oxidoreductase subunit J [Methanomethylophilus sp.]MDD3233082.1 NADH-quinone oxidoreductase subunit J [Methanomethylophilus sp.]MDD4221926.1 NADH-quinone oxidoreductase subunit J [Methanomethylophilus sp.]
MGLLWNIWDGFCNFANYVWSNGDLLAFLIVAALGVAAAIYVVTEKQSMHSAFYLALVFVTVAVTYFFLEAEFIGAIQLLVYVGAITILFAFCIMVTKRRVKGDEFDE